MSFVSRPKFHPLTTRIPVGGSFAQFQSSMPACGLTSEVRYGFDSGESPDLEITCAEAGDAMKRISASPASCC